MQWEGGVNLGTVMRRCAERFVDGVMLELGCGAVPIPTLVACRLGARRCVMTDGCDSVVEYAQANAERDRAHHDRPTELCARRLVWGDRTELDAVLELCEGLNWVVAADVVYNEDGTRALFTTLFDVLAAFPAAQVLLGYVVRGVSEDRIWSLAKEAGLKRLSLPEDLSAATSSSIQLALLGRRRHCVQHRCLKCDASAAVLVRQRDPLCVPCLQSNVESKFRSLFKLKNVIRPGDRVLIEGAASVEAQSALELLLQFRNPDPLNVRRWKTHFALHIVQLSDASDAAAEALQALLARHGDAAADIEVSTIPYPVTDWAKAFPELDVTSRADLERLHRHRCVLREAQRRDCAVLISLETSTALAHQLLSASFKGSGYGVASGLDLFDRRFEASYGVTLVRLLKDLSTTELAYFCHFKKLPTVARSPSAASTVDALSEQFIHSLHDTFPSGVSSLLRMGTKLKTAENSTVCRICAAPIAENAEAYCYSCRTHVTSKLDAVKLQTLRELI